MKHISFNKFSVILMYIAILGLFAICCITSSYPPDSFIISWMAFWCIQAMVTAVLHINKKEKELKINTLDAITPYLNEENVNQVIEKFLGIKPKVKK